MNYKSFEHITLNQKEYSRQDILELEHSEQNHFFEVVSFLKEWFSNSTTITVQTSGSTGKPKQISIPKQSFVESAKNTCEYLNLNSNTQALLCIPVKYIGGKMMVIRALVSGHNLWIEEPSSSPLKSFNQLINFIALTPMQAQLSLKDSLEKFKTIDTVIIGGGSVSHSFVNQIKDFKNKIYSTYGMTETVSHIALKKLNGEDASDNFEVLPSYSVTVNKENCIVIDCPTLFNERVVTNDLVKLTPKGFKWLGRIDNVINSGGVKLFPEEIERKIKTHYPNLVFYITSKKDSRLGEKLILVSENNISIDFNKCGLEKYEIPRETVKKKISFTETNKIIRKKI